MAKKKKEIEEVKDEKIIMHECSPLQTALINFGKVKAVVKYNPNDDSLHVERCKL